jgi:hypothetical protein
MPKETDVVHIYYDLRAAPITFDAATYFAAAVGTLRLQGYKLFDVSIIAPDYRAYSPRDVTYTTDQKDWRLVNLITRLPLLIPGVLNVHLTRSTRALLAKPRYPAAYDFFNITMPYDIKHLIDAARNGADVQVYSATDYARTWARDKLGPGKTIVMTLRGNDYKEFRDTPLDKWFLLYEHLSRQGYRVLIIPDQHDVLYSQKYAEYSWTSIPEAAVDLDLRLALYQECHATVAWAGGNNMLLWYSKTKFLIFGALNSTTNVTDAAYYATCGMTVGEPPSFFGPRQRIDWLDTPAITTDHLLRQTDAFLAEHG